MSSAESTAQRFGAILAGQVPEVSTTFGNTYVAVNSSVSVAPLTVGSVAGQPFDRNGILLTNGNNAPGNNATLTLQTGGIAGGYPALAWDSKTGQTWMLGSDPASGNLLLSFGNAAPTSNPVTTWRPNGNVTVAYDLVANTVAIPYQLGNTQLSFGRQDGAFNCRMYVDSSVSSQPFYIDNRSSGVGDIRLRAGAAGGTYAAFNNSISTFYNSVQGNVVYISNTATVGQTVVANGYVALANGAAMYDASNNWPSFGLGCSTAGVARLNAANGVYISSQAGGIIAQPGSGSLQIDMRGTAAQAGLLLAAGANGVPRAARIDFAAFANSTPQWTLINDYNQNGTNDLRIVSNNTVSTPLTITQSGNVGISGQLQPQYPLDVMGTGKFGTAISAPIAASNNGLILSGAAASSTGPHVTAYTPAADNYPLYQQLNWAHDNLQQLYDCYYDGSNTRASHTSTPFRWTKVGGAMQLQYANAATAGATLTGLFSSALLVASNGAVAINSATAGAYQFDVNGNMHANGSVYIESAAPQDVLGALNPGNAGNVLTIEAFSRVNTAQKRAIALAPFGGNVAIGSQTATGYTCTVTGSLWATNYINMPRKTWTAAGAVGANTYIKIATISTNVDTNNGQALRIYGTLGGFNSTTHATIDCFIASRASLVVNGTVYGYPSAAKAITDLQVFQEADTTYSIYIYAVQIYPVWDFQTAGNALGVTLIEANTTATVPTGTLVVSSVISQCSLYNDNGNVFVTSVNANNCVQVGQYTSQLLTAPGGTSTAIGFAYVPGSYSNPLAVIETSSPGNNPSMAIGVVRDGNKNYVQFQYDDKIRWFTANSESMRLTPTGLGIGTTNPQYPLDVVGNVRITGSTNANTVTVANGATFQSTLQVAGATTLSNRFTITGGECTVYAPGSTGGTASMTLQGNVGHLWWMSAYGNVTDGQLSIGGVGGAVPGQGVINMNALGSMGVGMIATQAVGQLTANMYCQLGQITGGTLNNSFTNGGSSVTTGNSYDAAASNHTITLATYALGSPSSDNCTGMLMIHTTNKSTTTTKVGIMLLQWVKAYGLGVVVSVVSTQKNTNLTAFSATGSSNDIVISTDSDCAITYTSFLGS